MGYLLFYIIDKLLKSYCQRSFRVGRIFYDRLNHRRVHSPMLARKLGSDTPYTCIGVVH